MAGWKVTRKDAWNSPAVPLHTHTIDKDGRQRPLTEEEANDYAKAYQASNSSCLVLVEKA